MYEYQYLHVSKSLSYMLLERAKHENKIVKSYTYMYIVCAYTCMYYYYYF